jgi:hypothetical protein
MGRSHEGLKKNGPQTILHQPKFVVVVVESFRYSFSGGCVYLESETESKWNIINSFFFI